VLTSSRAATAATVAGLATIVWLRLRAKGKPALRLAGIGLIFAALLAAAYGEVLYRVLDQFYALSTADRGLGSGATGRTAAWKAAWDLFVRNPALGVGFRAHEQSLGVDSSAHNGYLATLAEIGLPGFLAVLYLVARGMRLLRAGAKEPETGFTHSLLFGFCIAYLILAVFERYLINVGNPTSLLFLLCLMRPDGVKADVRQEDESWLPSEETSDDADPAAAGA
jgi:O-antigen ligase